MPAAREPTVPPSATAAPSSDADRWSALVSLARGLGLMVVLCSAVAGFLALVWGGLAGKLLYSFSIGLSCWAVIGALQWLVERWPARRPPPGSAAVPLARPARWSAVLGQAMLIAVGVVAGGSIGLSIADAIVGADSPPLWDWRSRGSQVTLLMTLMATVVGFAMMSARERLERATAQAEAARRAATEAELRLLQSQLEPHMLFNTLANLRVLIGLDPARAQAMLDRLIGFLRATLAASRMPLHPLAAEFARLDDYLALMTVRMGPRLQARLSLPPALRDCPVPPLLLQPLVENAIRHGLEPAVDGGSVDIEARRDGDHLVLEVRDTGVGLGASPHGDGSHFGLQQVRDRLRTLHGDRASVALGTAPGGVGTLATLTLPWPTTDAAGCPAHADAAAANATAAAGAAARPTDLRGPR